MRCLSDSEAARMLGLTDDALPSWTQGVVITDANLLDNPIIYASRGFRDLTGYDDAEILGRNCRFLQGWDTDRASVRRIRDAVASHHRYDGDILNYKRDGSPFWNHLSVGPLSRMPGEDLFAGLQLDVSSRHARLREPVTH